MDYKYSLEIEILELRLSAVNDFSKIKCILTVNNYTQCLAYPFNTMQVPIVDNYSVLEIVITHLNQTISGVDIPLTLFKNKKFQTFKLTDLQNSGKKKPSPVKPKNSASEITLGIKFVEKNPSIEDYKCQIKSLEHKLKESSDIIDEGLTTRKNLQKTFENATNNLAKMIEDQDKMIKYLLTEKDNIHTCLKTVEIELKAEKQRCEEFAKKKENNWEKFHPKNLKHERRHKSTDFLQNYDALQYKFSEEKKNSHFTSQISPNEEMKFKKNIESLQLENKQLRKEFVEANNKIFEYRAKIFELENKVSEFFNKKFENFNNKENQDKACELDKKNEEDFIRKSEDFNASEKTQTTESIILDLRGKITKMSAKYKNKISKLVTSQNFLIKENNEFKAKILDFEEKIEEKDGKIRRLIQEIKSLEERINFFDKNIEKPQDPSKLLGKYKKNSIKIVNSSYRNSEFIISEESPAKPYEIINLSSENPQTERSLSRVSKNQIFSSWYHPEPSDLLDLTLAEFITINKASLQVPFIREKEGVYLFGSKRVFLKLEQGKIYVRVGGGFMPIEEFIKIYSPIELEKSDRHKSTDLNISNSPFKKIILNENNPDTYKPFIGITKRSASVSKLRKF